MSSGGLPGMLVGSTSRWQKLHPTPSKSEPVRAEPSVGELRPSIQPIGAWQRRHRSPAKAASSLAIASAAYITGSCAAWPIMLTAQGRTGSVWRLKLPWQTVQSLTVSIGSISDPGGEPGSKKSTMVVGSVPSATAPPAATTTAATFSGRER